MNTQHVPAGTAFAVATRILSGQPWSAKLIKNDALRRHLKFLSRSFRTRDQAILKLRPDLERLLRPLLEKTTVLCDFHPKELAVIPSLIRMAYYREFWVRDPADWPASTGSTREQWEGFIAHLFERYPVARRWYRVWEIKGTLRYRERDWYCQLAQGAGRRSLEGLPDTINSRALHLSDQAPGELTMRQSFRWAQLKILQASEALIEAVLESPLVDDFSHDTIWFRLFQKVASSPDFDPCNFGIIADALLLLVRTGEWCQAKKLVNDPLQQLLNHCVGRWQSLPDHPNLTLKEIRRPGLRAELTELAFATWEPMQEVAHFQTEVCGQNGWRPDAEIIELTTHAQLLEESRRMHHCVDSYREFCLKRSSSIFTLRYLDESGKARPGVTIEVYRPKRRIVQVRRKRNDDPYEHEWDILRKWAEQNRLVF